MNWKEELRITHTYRNGLTSIQKEVIENLVTKWMEELIADIPEHSGWINTDEKIYKSVPLDKLKQQLRDKWL